jgi:hypothetical protein
MTYVTRSARKFMGAAALVLACLSVAAVQPQLAHASCGGWISTGHWFGCGEGGEWSLVAGGINSGGGNHADCVDLFGISGGKEYFPFGWECGHNTIYEEFPTGHGILYPAFYNSGSAEVNAFVEGI